MYLDIGLFQHADDGATSQKPGTTRVAQSKSEHTKQATPVGHIPTQFPLSTPLGDSTQLVDRPTSPLALAVWPFQLNAL